MKKGLIVISVLLLVGFSFNSVTEIGGVFDNNVYREATPVSDIGLSLNQNFLARGRLNKSIYYSSQANLFYEGYPNANLNNSFAAALGFKLKKYFSPAFNLGVSSDLFANNYLNDTTLSSMSYSAGLVSQLIVGEALDVVIKATGEKQNYANYEKYSFNKYSVGSVIGIDLTDDLLCELKMKGEKQDFGKAMLYSDSTGNTLDKTREDKVISIGLSMEWFVLDNITFNSSLKYKKVISNGNEIYRGPGGDEGSDTDNVLLENYYSNNQMELDFATLLTLKNMDVNLGLKWGQILYDDRKAIDENENLLSDNMYEKNVSVYAGIERQVGKDVRIGAMLNFIRNRSNDYLSDYSALSTRIYTTINF